MTVVAVFTVFLAAGAWIGVRYSEAATRIERDLTTYLLSIPRDEWKQ